MPPFRSPLLTVVCFALFQAGLFAQTQTQVQTQGAQTPLNLPALGDNTALSLGEERKLGDRIVRQLYRDPDLIEDVLLDEYVSHLWQSLLRAARQRGDLDAAQDERFAWRILLGKDRSLNAFALPGGYFGLHLGLIASVGTRDELATVLAHELAHVTQRHIARGMGEQSKNAPWLIGAAVLAMLAASKSPGAAQAVMVGSQAAGAQSQLNYSRDMEREADRIGLSILVDAGFDPQGAVRMFERLSQASKLSDSGAYPLLRSHPLTTERIADMQARLGFSAHAGQTNPPKEDLLQTLMAARARVLSQSASDDLRRWIDQAKSAGPLPASREDVRTRIGVLTSAALAHAKQKDFVSAKAMLSTVLPALVGDPAAGRAVRLMLVEVALAAGDPLSAAQTLQNMDLSLRAERLMWAQAQTRLGPSNALDEAVTSLQNGLLQQPADAPAWEILSQAQERRGRPVAALRAQAEGQMVKLEWAGAVDRLLAAQTLARNLRLTQDEHMEVAIVDTRLRQAQQLRREQLQER
jgi:beta-barrel assembly-enhancing protease